MFTAAAALIAVVAVIAAATGTAGLAAGFAVGNGVALCRASRWLRCWELRSGRRLLREPHWRWSAPGPHGWGRGRGMMDPRDFYAEAAPAP